MSTTTAAPITQLWIEDRLTHGLLTRRVIAWLLDALILASLAVSVWMAIATLTVLTFGLSVHLFATLAAVPFLYGWLSLISPMQASPGQALMGLVVVRDDDLGPPTALQAAIYEFCYLATMAAGAVWTALALVTTRHRTAHDILSGCVVVRRSVWRALLPPPALA